MKSNIVPFALDNLADITHKPIYEPVLFINSPAPVAREIFPKRFRLPYAFISPTLNVTQKLIDSPERPFILSLPVQIFPPSIRAELEFHQPSIRSNSDNVLVTVFPCSICAMERCNAS